jgi:hypothetical protein
LPHSIFPRSARGLARVPSRIRPTLAIATAVAAMTVVPASAQATDSCRASAARETVPGQVVSEPVVANPAVTPCATDSRRLAGVQPVGSASVVAPRADTRRAPGLIAASASVEGATLPVGGVPVSVGAVHASQVAACVNGVTVGSGASRVDALVIGGTPVPIVADRPVDQTIGPVRVRTNQLSGTTRRALILDDGTGRETVLGEVSAGGDACSGPGGRSGSGSDDPGGLGQICPSGADYDAAGNVCVIHESAGGGSDGQQETIVVGHPFDGPRGGSLISLDEARQRVKDGTLADSRCLRGKGPEYVVLGTDGANTITGANTADRILARRGNDHVSGGLGDDCIDGGSGRDRLTGDNGRDRMYGGRGRDRLSGSEGSDRLLGQAGGDVLDGGGGRDRLWGGSGADAVNGGSATDRLFAGAGNDSINTGYGRDLVRAGAGRDVINAATAGPASKRILCGAGRDKLRINRNERRRQHGCETVYTIR